MLGGLVEMDAGIIQGVALSDGLLSLSNVRLPLRFLHIFLSLRCMDVPQLNYPFAYLRTSCLLPIPLGF